MGHEALHVDPPVLAVHHHRFLDAQQVLQSLLALAVDLQRDFRSVAIQRERIAEDALNSSLGALFLERQCSGHRIAIAETEGRMAHPFGLSDPCPDIARSVEQFVGSVNAQIDELDIAPVRLGPTDMPQDIQGKLPAQVIVVPVVAEWKGDVKNTLVDKSLRVFHQVEDLLISPLAEDTLHARKVGAEQAAELRYIDHLVVHDTVVYILAVEPSG